MKHGGIAEIIATGICPGIFTATSRAGDGLRGVSRTDGTYFDRALGKRVPLRGRARQEFLRRENAVEVGEFKDYSDMKSAMVRKRKPKITATEAAKFFNEAKNRVNPNKPWSQMVQEHVKAGHGDIKVEAPKGWANMLKEKTKKSIALAESAA